MADYQQFQLLRQGVSVWNQWRREHPETHPDLNGADLSRTHLSKANLGKADLSGADLSFSDLRGADLSETDLHGANLRSARLHGSNLNRANLRGADLNQAIMAQTILGNINLRMVKGLETINHRGPSTIGIDTVLRSEGNIPEIFLRGTGATDTFIDYVRSLAQHPIEYYTCFISYSSKDQEFAERLHADLQQRTT